ncbi:MAG: hypothetical protein D4R73_09585 [Deltaproteobacteria bacterium]|nr:MAG: hypothetical protein D4R73_09585 [Deltaproteobacteria bacterium]
MADKSKIYKDGQGEQVGTSSYIVVLKRSRIEKFKDWLQIIAIFAAALWAIIFTFYYKEQVIPKSAPINISLNLELKKVPIINNQKQRRLYVIELNALAKNPSSRDVILLPSAFIVYGYKVTDIKLTENDFSKKCDRVLEEPYSMKCIIKNIENKLVSVIAAGGLYNDKVLAPNEEIGRSMVLHIPIQKYDFVEAIIYVPTIRAKNEIMLNWKFNKGKDGLIYDLYHTSDPKHEVIANDKLITLRKEIGLQFANTVKTLSLWRK